MKNISLNIFQILEKIYSELLRTLNELFVGKINKFTELKKKNIAIITSQRNHFLLYWNGNLKYFSVSIRVLKDSMQYILIFANGPNMNIHSYILWNLLRFCVDPVRPSVCWKQGHRIIWHWSNLILKMDEIWELVIFGILH